MNVHEQVLQSMKDMAAKYSAAGVQLLMPPPSVETLGTIYTEIDFGKMLAAETKFDIKFANPMQVYQGGFLSAAFDDVCGPLTYMATGKPVVTIELSTTFVRPFTAKDEAIAIKAVVVSRSKNLLVLRAEAFSRSGKLIATFSSHSLIAQSVSTDESAR